MSWIYKGKIIENKEDLGEGVFGFIYIITHTPTGKKYLGRKNLILNRKKKPTKKYLATLVGKGRKPKWIEYQVESDWKDYYGSNEEIKQMLSEGKQSEFTREIIDLAYNKKQLTYLETKYLFTYNILEENDNWYNNNILGKFYTTDF